MRDRVLKNTCCQQLCRRLALGYSLEMQALQTRFLRPRNWVLLKLQRSFCNPHSLQLFASLLFFTHVSQTRAPPKSSCVWWKSEAFFSTPQSLHSVSVMQALHFHFGLGSSSFSFTQWHTYLPLCVLSTSLHSAHFG